MNVIQRILPKNCYSPNKPFDLEGFVIHYISACFTNRGKMFEIDPIEKILKEYKFSYHFIILRSGVIYQLAPVNMYVHHAGRSRFGSIFGKSCNYNSIGIALVGGDAKEVGKENAHFELTQYSSCANLINQIKTNCPDAQINEKYLVGHDQVAIPRGRKKDPGKLFDYDLLKKCMRGDYGNTTVTNIRY